ncbi:SMP-30/gluconolactonase/LRE family protein [Rhodococcus sp. SGAir0479]|uniref:SMP-30/gluconolactonase/LRE family protein n=1 Tax=Rhodococcus sp. SGAir0479 TaxID=2567884 RepID=UPI0010CD6763|nr:SMP-30/gluconolactonase/LRE family protein [Rhodococcus sp. SGAir0479]QCQ91239.1 SMP-30/gluconolactonase/LRE family protein [Rhodococcus sp. SGAir0479]
MDILRSVLRFVDRTGVEPVAWHPPPAPAETGLFGPGRQLDDAQLWQLPTGRGPEDVAVDGDGRVVTGGDDGRLWRFDTDGRATELAHTGGRPLGVEVLDDGRFLVCDSRRGVLRVDETGRVEVLADAALGQPLLVCNNSAVGRDGVVYFTDSSARFPLEDHRLDLLEHSGTGRLLRFDPRTGEMDLLADGLQFANGVGLAVDESFVVVAETGSYRIRRVELTGPRAGAVSVWADNLPGIPDNVTSQTGDGIFWVALYSPRMALLDRVAPYPDLRVLTANLPDFVQPDPIRRAWVLGLDRDGRVVHSLRGGKGSYAPVTGVRETSDWLYLGSLSAGAIARVPRSVVGS